MPLDESSKIDSIRRLLSNETETPHITLPLATACEWAEEGVLADARMVVRNCVAASYSVTLEELAIRRGSFAFNMGGTRVYLQEEYLPSLDGISLNYTLRYSRDGNSTDLQKVCDIHISGLGRIAKVTVEKHSALPDLHSFLETELRDRIEGWYENLARYCDRQLRQLSTRAVDEIFLTLRNLIQYPYNEKIWLYAIIDSYGFSLADAVAQRRAFSAVLSQRSKLESSPLEAAISIIAVEMERERSFSGEILKFDCPQEVRLREALYPRIIQDAECALFQDEALSAMRLAITPNGDLGIVAAFPKDEATACVIVPKLKNNLRTFERILNQFATELRHLVSAVKRLTNRGSERRELTIGGIPAIRGRVVAPRSR